MVEACLSRDGTVLYADYGFKHGLSSRQGRHRVITETAPPTVESLHGSLRERDKQVRLQRRESLAESLTKWHRRSRNHYSELERLYRMHAPRGGTVLHVGCGIGDLPASLDDLSPAILATLPLDPYTGAGFIYRRLDDDPQGRDYVLYSAGEDRVDAAGEGDDVALASTLPAGAALLSEMLTHAQ